MKGTVKVQIFKGTHVMKKTKSEAFEIQGTWISK